MEGKRQWTFSAALILAFQAVFFALFLMFLLQGERHLEVLMCGMVNLCWGLWTGIRKAEKRAGRSGKEE